MQQKADIETEPIRIQPGLEEKVEAQKNEAEGHIVTTRRLRRASAGANVSHGQRIGVDDQKGDEECLDARAREMKRDEIRGGREHSRDGHVEKGRTGLEPEPGIDPADQLMPKRDGERS